MNHLVSLLVCIFSHYIRTYLLLLYASFLYGLKSKQLFGVFVRNIASFKTHPSDDFLKRIFPVPYNSASVMSHSSVPGDDGAPCSLGKAIQISF